MSNKFTTLSAQQQLFTFLDLYYLKRQFQITHGYREAIPLLERVLPNPQNPHFWDELQHITEQSNHTPKFHLVHYFIFHKNYGILKTAKLLKMSPNTVSRIRDENKAIFLDSKMKDGTQQVYNDYQALAHTLAEQGFHLGLV